jgi:hypothetical protein
MSIFFFRGGGGCGDYDKQKKISKNRGETEENDDYGKTEVKKK